MLMEQTSLVISKEEREGTERGWFFGHFPWFHSNITKGVKAACSLGNTKLRGKIETTLHSSFSLLNYTRKAEAMRSALKCTSL